jgi:hypothetical protein
MDRRKVKIYLEKVYSYLSMVSDLEINHHMLSGTKWDFQETKGRTRKMSTDFSA